MGPWIAACLGMVLLLTTCETGTDSVGGKAPFEMRISPCLLSFLGFFPVKLK
jgi:hypothetical protein